MRYIYTSKIIGDICITKALNQYTISSKRIEARSLNQFKVDSLMTQYSGLLQKPENTSLFAEGKPWNEQAVTDFIHMERSKWEAGTGFSVFSLFNTSAEFMGYLQIKHALEDFKDVGAGHQNVAEIIYMLDKQFWGQSYGTEIAILGKQFIKHYVAQAPLDTPEHDIKEIVATVHPENEGSKRILQKTLKQQEPKEFIKFGGQPRLLFFKSLRASEMTVDKSEPVVPAVQNIAKL